MKTLLLDPASKPHRLLAWARQIRLARKLAMVLVALAIAFGVATYGAITQSSNPFGPDPSTVIGLVLIDLTLLLALMVIITRRLVKLWLERRRGSAGSRLQTRIVLMFLLVSMIPTIIVAVFSTLFFNYGIQSWFDTRVNTALGESVEVAEAYLKEHKNLISADVWGMAAELNRKAPLLAGDPAGFNQLVAQEARERYLADAIVFQNNKILAKTSVSYSLSFEKLPIDAIKKAAQGKVVVLTSEEDDLVKALVKLEGFVDPYRLDYVDTYLLVGRFVDSKVLAHVEKTRGAATEYRRLQNTISGTQIKFSFVFLIVALLLLLVAAWVGMMFAVHIARPISMMVAATQRVKAGDLSARVAEDGPKNDEMGTLARAFNRMTEQLDRQRNELIRANHQIDARRHFIETVLAGVSAGVIALDGKKRISLFNPSAVTLLGIDEKTLHGAAFSLLFPEMNAMLDEAEKRPNKAIEGQVTLICNHTKLTLLVRIAAERLSTEIEGYVVTFDDVTELLSAQRRAAWSDVARRIAHEIKNPLTPIHLAAERLKRKYAHEVSDPATYIKYTDTVIRHVDSIGKMVEEFASFARMPAPVFAVMDLAETIRNTVFSRQCIEKQNIHYRLTLPEGKQRFIGDESQLTRVLTNLFKNAEEAMESSNGGTIEITLTCQDNSYELSIQDTGPGFPSHLLDRLTEPYVTTRSKGTGLGLAIVKKIIEDHGGFLTLGNNETGAYASIIFASTGD